jgi:hypothetical protein
METRIVVSIVVSPTPDNPAGHSGLGVGGSAFEPGCKSWQVCTRSKVAVVIYDTNVLCQPSSDDRLR